MKYYEEFNETGFNTAILTTYAFSAQAFEEVVLSKLIGAGCRNIVLLVDKLMLNTSISNFGTPPHAGAFYHIIKINPKGAFHPKISIQFGQDKGKLLIGSANLTASGLVGNRELVTKIKYTKSDPQNLAVFQQVLDYIKSYIPDDDPWFYKSLGYIDILAPWANSNSEKTVSKNLQNVQILANFSEKNILVQIKEFVENDEIENLIIISPYWDEQLNGLNEIREILNFPKTDILIYPYNGEFPIGALHSDANVSFFDIKVLNSRISPHYRFTHAKLFIAQGKKWDHIISGSMNCTFPALLNINAEMGTYKRVNKGTAVNSLIQSNYKNYPIKFSQISSYVPKSNSKLESDEIDIGDFKLESNVLEWSGVSGNSRETKIVFKLYDKNDKLITQEIMTNSFSSKKWNLPQNICPRMIEANFEIDGKVHNIKTFVTDINFLAKSSVPKLTEKNSSIFKLSENDTSKIDTIMIILNLLNMYNKIKFEKKPETENIYNTNRIHRKSELDNKIIQSISLNDVEEAWNQKTGRFCFTDYL